MIGAVIGAVIGADLAAGWGWVVAGLALCGAELLVPGAFLLWVGLAALAAGVATLALGLAPAAQLVAFAGVLAAALWIPLGRQRRRRRAGRRLEHGGDALAPNVNAPGADILGRTCRAIAFTGREGRVAFRDGSWPARVADGPVPEPGAGLVIVGLDGTTLLVVRA